MDLQNMQAARQAIQQAERGSGSRIPVLLTAKVESTGRLLDGSTILLFAARAQPFCPVALGLTGRYWQALPQLLNEISLPGAMFADVFAVASPEEWFQNPTALVEQVEPFLRDKRVRVVGVGLGARPEYVAALVASRNKAEKSSFGA